MSISFLELDRLYQRAKAQVGEQNFVPIKPLCPYCGVRFRLTLPEPTTEEVQTAGRHVFECFERLSKNETES